VPAGGTILRKTSSHLKFRKWLLSLHKDNGLAWTTVSKIRGIMHRTYKVGILHERVSKNPLLPVETRSKSNYRAIVITPAQTLAILEKLINPLHYALTLTCAATALRASEILALRWDDVLWNEGRIRISKRWAKGADSETKTEASDGYVPMHPLLSQHLEDWHRQSPHAKGKDFAFPSLTAEGKVPLNACSFVKDHLRVAAKASGVRIADGQRFGLHNLRHSLSNWLVN
jgi:integrase